MNTYLQLKVIISTSKIHMLLQPLMNCYIKLFHISVSSSQLFFGFFIVNFISIYSSPSFSFICSFNCLSIIMCFDIFLVFFFLPLPLLILLNSCVSIRSNFHN